MKIGDIKSNPQNPRVIKDEKFKQLVKSLREFPEMMAKRPMVCVTDPADGKLFPLGGNMRLKALIELKYKDIPDEWVMMADEWTEEKRREFVIKDNLSMGEWSWDDLTENWDSDLLEDWGLDIPEKKEINECDLLDINIPFYTPSDEVATVDELFNSEKVEEIVSKINLLNTDEDVKSFLRLRAAFFTDFNFQKIADYYCSQEDEDVKSVFRSLGLIILAQKEAIEIGFAQLHENLIE